MIVYTETNGGELHGVAQPPRELAEVAFTHNAALQGQVFFAADGSSALILTGDAEGGDLIEVYPDGTTHHALTGVWETGHDA